jgi:hypothetical protein
MKRSLLSITGSFTDSNIGQICPDGKSDSDEKVRQSVGAVCRCSYQAVDPSLLFS